MSLIPQNPSINSVSGTTVSRRSGSSSSGQIPTINVNSSDTAATSSSSNQVSTNQYAFSTWASTTNPNATAEKENQFSGSEWQRLGRDAMKGAIQAQGIQDAWKVLSAGLQSMIAGLGKLGQAMAQAQKQGGGNGESGAPEQNQQQRESSLSNRDRGSTDLFV